MSGTFYPSVDIDFIEKHIKASGRLAPNGIKKFDSTTFYILNGSQAIYKRIILVQELPQGQVCLEQATALAFKFSFLTSLIEWLEKNRSWKEGAYIIS